ncbi:MAG: hypothetical protein U0271_26045 [Polyangiaceae bacterium]
MIFVALLAACGDSGSGGGGQGGSGASSGGGGQNSGGTGGAGGASAVPCADVCPDVVAAACSAGPPTVAECVNGCETILAGPCADLYDALYVCAGSNPSYQCTPSGQVQVAGCADENTALYNCLAGA